jgi:antitoxin component of RelBE/YafQ-DinJ toxin-antitoxin module
MPKKIISVRFDEQLHEIINQEAQKKGMKPSDYIRETLKGGLKEYEVSPTPSQEHIEMPVKESEEEPTEEDFEKRLQNKLKELENKIAGVGKLPDTPTVEKAEIELSDDELDAAIKEAVKPEKTVQPDPWVCGGCSYVSDKQFNQCPKCGAKLTW